MTRAANYARVCAGAFFTVLIASPATAQEPANPVGFIVACTIPSGGTTCNAQVAVPAGKRLVIESISAKVVVPSGETAQLYVVTPVANIPSGSIASRHFIPLTRANSSTAYFANLPIRMYASTGGYVQIVAQRIQYAGTTSPVVYDVWFSGYLLP